MKMTKEAMIKFKQMGVIDYSQNWLELFNQNLIDDLFAIMNGSSDNQRKVYQIEKLIKSYGFRIYATGTNICTFVNGAYPGVVFKIALDDNGIADNFNDPILCEMVNDILDYPRYNEVLAKHPSGIVSVHRFNVVIESQEIMDEYRLSILKALKKLASYFIIIDLSPTYFHLNYGIDRNGNWVFIDASDLYPLVDLKEPIRCKNPVGFNDKKQKMVRCGGRLKYNDDFSAVICTKCGRSVIPSEIKPQEKEGGKKTMVKTIMDGMTVEEREKLRKEELSYLLEQSEERMPDPPKKAPFVKDRVEVKSASTMATLPTKSNPQTIVVDNNGGNFVEDDEEDEEIIADPPMPQVDELQALKNLTATVFNNMRNGEEIDPEILEGLRSYGIVMPSNNEADNAEMAELVTSEDGTGSLNDDDDIFDEEDEEEDDEEDEPDTELSYEIETDAETGTKYLEINIIGNPEWVKHDAGLPVVVNVHVPGKWSSSATVLTKNGMSKILEDYIEDLIDSH